MEDRRTVRVDRSNTPPLARGLSLESRIIENRRILEVDNYET
jgi:hypothetical protein